MSSAPRVSSRRRAASVAARRRRWCAACSAVASSFAPGRQVAVARDDDAHRVAALGEAHGELRVVAAHRAGADHDRVARAARSSCTARRLSRQLIQRASPPAAATLPSSVTAALYVTSGRPVRVELEERRVLLAGPRPPAVSPRSTSTPPSRSLREAAAVDQRVRVAAARPRRAPRRPPRARRRRAASCRGDCTARACSTAWRRGRARRPRASAMASACGSPGPQVPAAPDDLSVAHEDGADQRVGVRAARGPARPGRTPRPCTVVVVHTKNAPKHALQGGRRRGAAACFSHPDCDRRPRNLTWSTPHGVRGLYRRWGLSPRPEAAFGLT